MSELERRPPDEVRGLSDLAFGQLADFLGGIGAIQRAIAGRVFSATGPAAKPVELIHDTVSAGVYAGLRGGSALLGRGAGEALARRARAEGRELSTTPRGSAMLAAINGLMGDVLEREDSDLQEPMAVRVAGRPVAAEPDALAEAFPEASPQLVVFLHGLMETEFAWRLGARQHGGTYGSRLAEDLGCTPVDVRYNTGRHISENGRSLAELLEELVGAWPVEVERIALVGHSMGGLVARSACHYASTDHARWVGRVRHVVSLGSPHMGAPLEQLRPRRERGPQGTARDPSLRGHPAPPQRRHPRPAPGLPRGRGLARLRSGRSARRRRDGGAAAGGCHPLLRRRHHHSQPKHPLARLVGDALVLEASASGRARDRRIPFDEEYGMRVGGTHHLALLNHPEVYERLRDWLAPSRARRLEAVAEMGVVRGQHREDQRGRQAVATVGQRLVHALDQGADVGGVAEVVPGLRRIGEQPLARGGLERAERAGPRGRFVHARTFDARLDDPARIRRGAGTRRLVG